VYYLTVTNFAAFAHPTGIDIYVVVISESMLRYTWSSSTYVKRIY
jgi:hypothetical protein